jgi:putative membrane protein
MPAPCPPRQGLTRIPRWSVVPAEPFNSKETTLMRTPAPIVALTLALAAFPAAAQQAAKSELSRQDKDFAEHAMAGGMMEVQLGKLAEQRAQNEGVKRFGQRMVTDHSQANQKMSEVGSRLGLSAPAQLPREQSRTVEKLAGLSGAEFDRAYMAAMIDDHKKDISAFRKQADKGDNAQLKSLAQETLPTLEQHLRLAEDTQAKLGGQQAQTPR